MKLKFIQAACLSLLVINATAQDFVNGGFETGDYTGWTIQETSGGLYGILDSEVPYDGTIHDFYSNQDIDFGEFPFEELPLEGTKMAINLQEDAGLHRIYQDIAVSESDDLLQFMMAWNNFDGIFVTDEQTVQITVRDVETDEIIETLYDPADDEEAESIIPLTIFCFDISEYSGETIRISLDFYIFVAPIDLAFDNFKISDSSINPDTPTLSSSVSSSCPGADVVLSIASGELNSAGYWEWYEDSCEGEIVGTGTSLIVNPIETTSYVARAVGGCSEDGACSESVTITVGEDDLLAPVPDNESLPVLEAACSLIITDFPTATDACIGEVVGMPDMEVGFDGYEYYLEIDEPGEYLITWTYYDAVENMETQTQNVIIYDEEGDTFAPVPNKEELPDLIGACYLELSEEVVPMATDGCSGTVYGDTEGPYEFFEPGEYVITWTYEDESGNTSEQTQNVILLSAEEDTFPPVFDEEVPGGFPIPVCAPLDEFELTAYDVCDDAEILGIPNRTGFTEEDIDNFVFVTWTFEDSRGNTSQQTIGFVIYNNGLEVEEILSVGTECSYEVTDFPVAYDECDNEIVGTTDDPTSFDEEGEYEILWVFEDEFGSYEEVTQNIYISDNDPIPDVIELPLIEDACTFTFPEFPTATDACDGIIIATTEDATSFDGPGEYSVTWVYEDSFGNVVEQTQDISVYEDGEGGDTYGPVPDIGNIDITANCSVTVSEAPTATDGCDGAFVGTLAEGSLPLTFSEFGEYEITWYFEDTQENVTEQVQVISVIDDVAPVVDADNIDITANCSVTVSEAPTATDNCAGAITGTLAEGSLPLTFSEFGEYEITWYFEDDQENITEQVQVVTVIDDTAPVADTETLEAVVGDCEVTVVTVPTATDNCSGAINGTTEDPLTYSEVGEYEITWSYTDSEENVTTQTQVVSVIDDTAPVADVETLEALTSICLVTVSTVPTATDDCTGNITGTTQDPLIYSEPGNYTVTWQYEDASENITEQTQTITILEPFDTSVSLSGTTLTANLDGATYQWLDCNNDNAVIDGATEQSFTTEESGSYAVAITFESCTITSTCNEVLILGLTDELESRIMMYPNPTFDHFSIDMTGLQGAQVYINNINGQLIESRVSTRLSEQFDLTDHPNGLYIISVKKDSNLYRLKLVKK